MNIFYLAGIRDDEDKPIPDIATAAERLRVHLQQVFGAQSISAQAMAKFRPFIQNILTASRLTLHRTSSKT